MSEYELKNNIIMQPTIDTSPSKIMVSNDPEDALKDEIKSLRAQLMDLLSEQKKWQSQLLELGENMTLDDVHDKIKQAQDIIIKHQKIIAKCEKREKELGRKVRLSVPFDHEDADSEYTIPDVVNGYFDGFMLYSVEHSQKRITFWRNNIAQHEQTLTMMEIAQQQLKQVMAEIADVNDQIKNATMRLLTEPMMKNPSSEIETVFILENNRESKNWIYTDKATSEDKERFKKHIEYLCENNSSAQLIKKYIQEQEKNCILEHLNFTKQYEILKEIGVDFKKKTYLNS